MGTELGMAGTRTLHRLTELKCKRLSKPGRHADGAGLYLDVSPAGARHWVFLFARKGKRTELGLGGYPETTLAEAREKADKPASSRAAHDGICHRPIHCPERATMVPKHKQAVEAGKDLDASAS
jgi:Arm DNA-binding domain